MAEDPEDRAAGYAQQLMLALSTSEFGNHLLQVALGNRQIVLKQNRHGEGYVLDFQPIQAHPKESVGAAPSEAYQRRHVVGWGA